MRPLCINLTLLRLRQRIHLLPNAQLAKLPHVGLHSHAVELVLAQVRQPQLHRLGVPIADLDKASQCLSLKVLLRLLEDEVVSGDGPALCDAGERHGAVGGQAEVVGGAEGKVGEEFEGLDAVGSELEIARGDAVLGLAL